MRQGPSAGLGTARLGLRLGESLASRARYMTGFGRPAGTWFIVGIAYPAMNCWAKVTCPSGA